MRKYETVKFDSILINKYIVILSKLIPATSVVDHKGLYSVA